MLIKFYLKKRMSFEIGNNFIACACFCMREVIFDEDIK